MPERLGDYPEFLPLLKGWDFRINLPHVRFQDAGAGSGSPAALVGVLEDATPATSVSGPIMRYGHRNNSTWVLRRGKTGQVYEVRAPTCCRAQIHHEVYPTACEQGTAAAW
jgi:hypothetical protein